MIKYLKKTFPYRSDSTFFQEILSFFFNATPVLLSVLCIIFAFYEHPLYWGALSIVILIDFFIFGPRWKALFVRLGIKDIRPRVEEFGDLPENDQYGMPSAHMSSTFLFLIHFLFASEITSHFNSGFLLSIIILFAIGVAWQRLHTRMHQFHQLLVGSLIGLMTGIVTKLIFQFLGLYK